MNNLCLAVGATALLVAASWTAAARADVVDRFIVNAQYRGAVKRSYREVGAGSLSNYDRGRGRFQVRARGTFQHPRQGTRYTFDVSKSYEVSGTTVRVEQGGL